MAARYFSDLVLGQPGVDIVMPVVAVVVQGHVHGDPFRHFLVDLLQEVHELVVGLPLQALADHGAAEHF